MTEEDSVLRVFEANLRKNSFYYTRRYHVVHSSSGFRLSVMDHSRLALFLESVIEHILSLAGHPCCGRGIGKLDIVNALAFRLLNFPTRFPVHQVVCLPLPVEQARILASDFVADVESGAFEIEDE